MNDYFSLERNIRCHGSLGGKQWTYSANGWDELEYGTDTANCTS